MTRKSGARTERERAIAGFRHGGWRNGVGGTIDGRLDRLAPHPCPRLARPVSWVGTADHSEAGSALQGGQQQAVDVGEVVE